MWSDSSGESGTEGTVVGYCDWRFENPNGCYHQSHVMRCLLSGSRLANFPEACWLKESSCVSWWLWVSSILGRGFRVESLRSVLLSNELLLFSALLFTLNWKSIAQEKYEPWKLNSGKTIQENDLSSKGDHKRKIGWNPFLFFLMVIRISFFFIWCQLHL